MRQRPDIERAPLWFDPWLVPTGETLQAIAADVLAVVEGNEEGRTRRRKPVDQRTFERCVSAIVANLALSALSVGRPAIGVPLGAGHVIWSNTRYARHGLKLETFRKLLDAMHGEFLVLKRSTWRGTASNIRPTPEFAAMIEAHGVTLGDVGQGDGEPESIVLTLKREGNSDGASKEYVDYRDTTHTKAMRKEMATLNRHLENARLEFLPDVGRGPCDGQGPYDGLSPLVFTAQRRLTRRFLLPSARHPKSFAYGGRLYGGFWENLSRERRRASLRIDGEPIAEVDLSACFLRLAFAKAGMELDTPDPYSELFGVEKGPERDALKGAMAALLFAPRLSRWPEEHAKQLPPRLSPSSVRRMLFQRCPDLEGALFDKAGIPIGFALFRVESEILLEALRSLRARRSLRDAGVGGPTGVVALPLHDAVLVARSKADVARESLERAALSVAGVRIPVSVWTGQ